MKRPFKSKSNDKKLKKKLPGASSKSSPVKSNKKISLKLSNISKLGESLKHTGEKVFSHAKETIIKRFSPPPDFALPTYYDETRAVLLVRDPWWVFAYWEVRADHEQAVTERVRSESDEVDKKILRLTDVGEWKFFDIEIGPASDWYIDLGKPERECFYEIGLRTRRGRFFPLVRSNTVKTPPYGFSNVIDEEWMLPEDSYWKLFGFLAASAGKNSSFDFQEHVRKFIQSISSRGSAQLTDPNEATKTRTEISVKIQEKKF